MYNLCVSTLHLAWDGRPYTYELGRAAREYTAEGISKRFAAFDDLAVAELVQFPTLFAYERGQATDALMGQIKSIQKRGGEVRLQYELDAALPPIPHGRIKELEWELDISDWEMNRTHWAVKDVDLFKVLEDAGILPRQIGGKVELQGAYAQGLLPAGIETPIRPKVFRIPVTGIEADLVSVMMPFDAAMTGVYKTIRQVCGDLNLRCARADEIWNEDEVIQDIFSLIYRSKVIVCDFSARNANVFYETGIAHTLGRKVIPIVQNEADVPFDLRHYRYIKYLKNNEGLTQLARDIRGRLEYVLAEQ